MGPTALLPLRRTAYCGDLILYALDKIIFWIIIQIQLTENISVLQNYTKTHIIGTNIILWIFHDYYIKQDFFLQIIMPLHWDELQ
jgi:hypothetical protein